MTKYFLFSSCLLMATVSALAQQFPMDQFMGVNLRREDPIERLKCVGFVREYHDWAVDESNAYNFRIVDSLKYPSNQYSWSSRQSTSIKFDDFYETMLLNLPAASRPPICATMKQCLPYLAGGDTYGTYSEIKPVPYYSSGRAKPTDGFPQTNVHLEYTPRSSWKSPDSYGWIADWLYQFTRRYGANRNPITNIPKLKAGESDKKGLNQVGYIELWNEPNKYWIRSNPPNPVFDSLDNGWLRATKFTGAEYAAMASATYDAHKGSIMDSTEFGVHYRPGIQSADSTMKFVMGGSAGIREYDWRFLQDMKNWFDTARATASQKYPFDVINFHHYNSNRWFGIGGSGTESLKLNTEVPVNGSLRVYYYERRASEWADVPKELDLGNQYTKLYAENIQKNDFVVSNLKLSHNPYVIYVQVVDTNGNVGNADSILVKTTSCFNNFIPRTRLFNPDPTSNNTVLNQLFDYGDIDFCYPLRTKNATDGNNTYEYLGEWNSTNKSVSLIHFDDIHTLDAVSILGGTGAGTFTIEYWDRLSGSFKPWVRYLKDGFDEWKTFPGLKVPVTQLRLTKEKNMGIRKMILKGKPAVISWGRDTFYKVVCCGDNDTTSLAIKKATLANPTISSLFGNLGNFPLIEQFKGIMRVENCTLVVDRAFFFEPGSKIYMSGPNAAILVPGHGRLEMNGTNVRGCDELWQGIIVDTGATIKIENASIRDAAVGIRLLSSVSGSRHFIKTWFNTQNTLFEENITGVSTTFSSNSNRILNLDPESNIQNCIFEGNFRDLKPTPFFTARQAMTGLELEKITLSMGGGNDSFPNQFHDLAIGIDAKESVLSMNNTIFNTIQPKRVPSYVAGEFVDFGGTAIQARDSKIRFKGKGGKLKSPAVFNRVQRGIDGYYTDVEVDSSHFYLSNPSLERGNAFFPTEYALQCTYGKGDTSRFTNNYVKSGQMGVQIWKSGGIAAILNNEIDCTASTIPADAVSIGSYYHQDVAALLPYQRNAQIRVHDNIIKGQNAIGGAMLSVGMAQNMSVRRNKLYFNNYEKDSMRYNIGIRMTLLEKSAVVGNYIKGFHNDAGFFYSPTSAGILSINSRQDTISCNRIDSARMSMVFQYNNLMGSYYGSAATVGYGATGEGNIAGDTLTGYNIALKIDNFALVGKQTHRRNVWSNPDVRKYYADAILENPNASPDRKRDNRFSVDTHYLPKQISPMDWFEVQITPNGFNCGDIPGIVPIGSGSLGAYETVLAGEYQAPEAYLWMLEKQAFEEFSELPANVQTAAMQSFLSSKQGTEIETFYQLKKGFESLFQQDAGRAERLKQLNQFMDDWAKKKQFIDNQALTEDAFINAWSKEYMELSALEKQSSVAKATALQQLNATLPDDGFTIRSKTMPASAPRPYIFYEKVVNRLYLSKIIAGTGVYTEKEADLLKKIAMMCPLIAAEAPMKARVIYQHFVNPMALPEADCSNVPNTKLKTAAKPHFTVYPNPTNQRFTLISEDGLKGFNWALFTSTGVLVKEGIGTTVSESIDTQDLANGVYFICIKDKGIITTTLKVVVMK